MTDIRTYPCCSHCEDDQPHIAKDTHDLPCDRQGCQVWTYADALAEIQRLRADLAQSGSEIDRLRAALALIDTPCFLHLGPGHSTLHDDQGEELAGAEPGEHELWVRLHTMDALEQIKAVQPEEKL